MSKGLEFYRCAMCRAVVSIWDVKDGGCPKCRGVRIVPSRLGLWEKFVQILKHPRLWTWHKQSL